MVVARAERRGAKSDLVTKETWTSQVKRAELWAGKVLGPKLGYVVSICFACREYSGAIRREEYHLQDGKVREIVNVAAKVCLSAANRTPLISQGLTGFADDLHWGQEVADLEAGGEDDDIELLACAVLAGDSRLVDLFDSFCD